MLKEMVSLVLAETPAAGGQSQPTFMGALGSMLPMIVIFFVFMFVVVWYPENKRKKAHQEMLLKLKSGDRVLLSNGMRGTVAQVRDDVVVVEISPKVPVEFERGVIAAILADEAAGDKK